jgi:hypothetical protein
MENGPNAVLRFYFHGGSALDRRAWPKRDVFQFPDGRDVVTICSLEDTRSNSRITQDNRKRQ